MNAVFLSGNLVRDVEVRFAASGSAVANFTVASNRKWTDRDGQKKEEVSFIGVVAFGKQAELIGQYFKKGSPIVLNGRLKQESWEDKTTKKKQSKTVVVLEGFEFTERASSGGGGTRTAAHAAQPAATERADAPEAAEDDVPF